jgi:hypothetical protein
MCSLFCSSNAIIGFWVNSLVSLKFEWIYWSHWMGRNLFSMCQMFSLDFEWIYWSHWMRRNLFFMCQVFSLDFERIHWSHRMGPSQNSLDSSVDWTRTSELHSHFVMMRAFWKALPSIFKMLTLNLTNLFSHNNGYQREKLNIKNETRSLCSVKPIHAKLW